MVDSKESGKNAQAKGERSIAIGGDVAGASIHTGDIHIHIEGRKGLGLEFVDQVTHNLTSHLISLISEDAQENLERMRTAYREGRRQEVVEWIKTLKKSKWEILSYEAKAKVLRFEAGLELGLSGNIDKVKILANEAHAQSPEDDESRIRALIAFRERDLESALNFLQDKSDVDSLNLKAAILLEMGDRRTCQEVFENIIANESDIHANAETHRLKAIFHLLSREINHAQLEIQKAVELSPNWESVRYTNAVVEYYSSLSPAAQQTEHISWPVPVIEGLVKADGESLIRLRNAVSIFRELADHPEKSDEERITFEVWYLACLSNDPDQRDNAVDHAKSILQIDKTDFRTIAWIIARQFEVDLEQSTKALKELVKNGLASLPQIMVLATIDQSEGKAKKATYLLEKTRAQFTEQDAEKTWGLWYALSLVQQGSPDAALKFIEKSVESNKLRHAKNQALRAIALGSGSWDELLQELDQGYRETGDPNLFLGYYQVLLEMKDWSAAADRGEELLAVIQTGQALRLSAIATYNAQQFQKCFELLEKKRALFRNNILPPDLKQLRIDCMQSLGMLSEAVIEAEKNALDKPTAENLITFINVSYNKGDFRRLVMAAKKLMHITELPSHVSLQLAHMVQGEDVELARSLWKKSLTEIPDALVAGAFALGHRLGLVEEVSTTAQG